MSESFDVSTARRTRPLRLKAPRTTRRIAGRRATGWPGELEGEEHHRAVARAGSARAAPPSSASAAPAASASASSASSAAPAAAPPPPPPPRRLLPSASAPPPPPPPPPPSAPTPAASASSPAASASTAAACRPTASASARVRVVAPAATPRLPGPAFYVATTGSDSNPGTQASPWRTVQKALNTPGRQIAYLRAGTYSQNLMLAAPAPRARRSPSATTQESASCYSPEPARAQHAARDGERSRLRPLPGPRLPGATGSSTTNIYADGNSTTSSSRPARSRARSAKASSASPRRTRYRSSTATSTTTAAAGRCTRPQHLHGGHRARDRQLPDRQRAQRLDVQIYPRAITSSSPRTRSSAPASTGSSSGATVAARRRT